MYKNMQGITDTSAHIHECTLTMNKSFNSGDFMFHVTSILRTFSLALPTVV